MGKQFLMASAIIRQDGNLLLVRNRWPVGTFWGIPGGQVELGEALADAAAREVREETGLDVAPIRLAYVHDTHNLESDWHYVYHVFECRVVGGALAAPCGDEYVDAVRWVPEADLARYLTWPCYRDAVLAYLQGTAPLYQLQSDAGLKPGEPATPAPE